MQSNTSKIINPFDPFVDESLLQLLPSLEATDSYDPFVIYRSPKAKRRTAVTHNPQTNSTINPFELNFPQTGPLSQQKQNPSDADIKDEGISDDEQEPEEDVLITPFDPTAEDDPVLSFIKQGQQQKQQTSTATTMSSLAKETEETHEREVSDYKQVLARQSTILKHEADSLTKDIAISSFGVLKVRIVEASGLTRESSIPNALVKISLLGKRNTHLHTDVYPKNPSPKWNEEFRFALEDFSHETLVFSVKDAQFVKHKMCKVTLALSTLNLKEISTKWEHMWLPLVGSPAAKLHLSLKWYPNRVLPVKDTKRQKQMHVPRLRIKIESRTFYSGETIRGQLKLCVGAPILVNKGLFLRFRGKELVDTTQDGRDIYGESVLVNKAYSLMQSKEQRAVGPGRYNWNFSVVLREDLPSTFVDYFGFIRYVLYASIDEGKVFFFSIPVTIVCPYRISMHKEPNSGLAIEKRIENHHVAIMARLKSWIYFLGQDTKMLLHLEVTNSSSHNLAYCNIKFIERRIAYGQNLEVPFVENKTYASRNLGDIAPAKNGRFSKDFTIALPPNYAQPSITQNSKLIFIKHFIVISTCKASLTYKHKQRLEIPVTFTYKAPEAKKIENGLKPPLQRTRSFSL